MEYIGNRIYKKETHERTIKVKKLNDKAKLPTRGSAYSAGYDLHACIDEEIYIPAHETRKIKTGLAMELPHEFFGAIFPRSGLATKQGLRMANCVAVIDEDYRGEWIIPLHNDTNIPQKIEPGERIAQLVLLPYQVLEFNEVEELSDTVRGDGGFGSTGKQ